MTENVGTLGIEIKAEIDDLTKKLQAASDKLGEFSKGAENVGKSATSGFTAAVFAGNLMASATASAAAAVKEFFSEGIRMGMEYEQSLAVLTRSVGANAEDMVRSLRAASQGNLSNLETVQEVNRAMAMGIEQSQLAPLMEVAIAKSRQMGMSTTEAFDNIIMGIGRMSSRMLTSTGIIIDEQAAFKTYADSVGRTVGSLSDLEKRLALTQEVMNSTRTDVKLLGGDMGTAADETERLSSEWKDLMTSVGGFLSRGVVEPAAHLANVALESFTYKEMSLTELRRKSWEAANRISGEAGKKAEAAAKAAADAAAAEEKFNTTVEDAIKLENSIASAQQISAMTLEKYSEVKEKLNDLYQDPAVRNAVIIEQEHSKALKETASDLNAVAEAQNKLNASLRSYVDMVSGGGRGSSIAAYELAQKGMLSKREERMYGWTNMPKNDFVMRPGQEAVSFNSSDTIIGVKDVGDLVPSSSSRPIQIENTILMDGRQVYNGTQMIYQEENLRRGG